MAHKTFISYKFSEAKGVRDRIIHALGDDATYYKGETSDSPDLTDLKTETIKKKLSEMIYDTSVTIVVLSPNMRNSEWMDWEIEYSLKRITRNDRTSQTNGVVGVVMKYGGSYDWFIKHDYNCHQNPIVMYEMEKVHDIIRKNHFNSKEPVWHCDKCRTYDRLMGSYISFVSEDEFIDNASDYIDNAYEKSKQEDMFNITRTRK